MLRNGQLAVAAEVDDGRLERRGPPQVAQPGFDSVYRAEKWLSPYAPLGAPADECLEGSGRVVVVLLELRDDVVMIEGEPMIGM
jgi:hypothetical protein